MKKLLSILLSTAMVVSLVACGSNNANSGSTGGETTKAVEETKGSEEPAMEVPDMTPPEDSMAAVPQSEILAKVPTTPAEGRITFGSTTEPDAYIMGGFTNPSSNQNARYMLTGYETFSYDKNNEIVRNNVVLKDFKETKNEDGSITYEEEIYDNLKWSDGTPITAKDYVFSKLINSHKLIGDIGGDATDGYLLTGYKEFNESDGTTPFSGVRLLGDYKFSLTISKEELPNYYALNMGGRAEPFPMKALNLSTGIVDNGKGAAFEKALDVEELKTKILDPEKGLAFTWPVSAGPYKFVKFDKGNKALILEANPEFLGTFDGWKPRIKDVVIKYSQDKIVMDELANGTIDIASESSGKNMIESGLQKVEESNGKLDVVKFERNGFGDIQLQCDVGATKFIEVRQALAYAIDRNDIMKKYTGGYGKLVHAEYGLAQPEYKANKKLFEEKMNPYNFDLNKAKELLVKGGWTLNAKGGEFVEGTDEVRYKKLEDGTLLACELNWANTQTPVSELLNADLPTNLKSIGVKLNSDPVDFPKLIKHMYAAIGSEERSKYNMYVLGLGFATINPYWDHYSADPAFLTNNNNQLIDDKLTAIVQKMKNTKPGDKKTWYASFAEMQLRLNELMAKIPLYSDLYHLFYNKKVGNLNISSIVPFGRAIVYATLAE